MTGAMYSAIAGLRTHMQDLNVIGNNVANVNTKGYKPGRSIFRTSLYTQISSGREGTSVVGSKNPSQLGYGSNLTTVDVDMSTGTPVPGLSSDMMIDGDGFFLLGNKEMAGVVDPRDPSTLKSFTLSRVGDISFKSDGYLSDGPGNLVYGFLCVGTVNGEPVFSDQLVPIRKPRIDQNGNIMWPHTEMVAPEGEEATDENGKLTLVDTLYPEGEGDNDQVVQNPYGFADLTGVTITDTGLITAKVRSTGQEITIGALAIGIVDNPNGVTQLSSSYYQCGAGAGDLTVNMVGGAGKEALVAYGNMPRTDAPPDETETETFIPPTEYGQTATYGDVTIRRGMRYVNESQVNAGDDAGTDEELSLPHGSQVFDTGTATILISNYLEQSKTDLATEISNMITTQRGYQANTRIITVTDSMLEELVNMKRG